MGPPPTEMSPAHRKYNSGLSKVGESRRGSNKVDSSPAIVAKRKAKKASGGNADLAHSKTVMMARNIDGIDEINNDSSSATFVKIQ